MALTRSTRRAVVFLGVDDADLLTPAVPVVGFVAVVLLLVVFAGDSTGLSCRSGPSAETK